MDSTKEINTDGIGLGLHICHMLVTQFNGTVSCSSEVGEGSTFTFTFKLSNSEDQPNIARTINPSMSMSTQQQLTFQLPSLLPD